MARHWAESVSPQMKGQTLAEKVESLVALLKAEGHLVAWGQGDDSLFIYEYDCRFYRVAQAHPEVCSLPPCWPTF